MTEQQFFLKYWSVTLSKHIQKPLFLGSVWVDKLDFIWCYIYGLAKVLELLFRNFCYSLLKISIDIFEMDYKFFIFKRKWFIAHNL